MQVIRILFLLLVSIISSAQNNCENIQYDLMRINLSIKTLKNTYNTINVDLYQQNSIYLVELKSRPINNDARWIKSKIDTVYVINKNVFNKICKMFTDLSLEQFLNMKELKDLKITNDGIACELKVSILQNSIKYSFGWDIDEKRLEPFLDICKEIMCLTKLNSKKNFGKRIKCY